MPFVKKIIHLSSIHLNQKIIPRDLHVTINDHQRIITAAHQTAHNLIRQASIKANRLVQKSLKKIHQRESQTQHMMRALIDKTKAQSEQMKQSIAIQTKQEIWQQANHLIETLNKAKQGFFDVHHDFFKSIINDLIHALIRDIPLKMRLEIIAYQVIEKAKGLDEGIIYFNQNDLDSLPTIKLPFSWKILVDDDVPHQTCKLHAQGSDWYINFEEASSNYHLFFNQV